MDCLLDAPIIGPLFRDDGSITTRFALFGPEDGLYTPVITEGELLPGALKTPGRPDVAQISSLLDSRADVFQVTRPAAVKYGEIKRDLSARGSLIPDSDLWTAAVAAADGPCLRVTSSSAASMA